MAEGKRSNTWPTYGQGQPKELSSMKISEPNSNIVSSQESPFHHWDTQATFIPMFPALRYISRKLAQRKLYIPLIVTDYGQSIMPAWSIPRSAQTILSKIVSKACLKFRFGSSWMTALASTSGKQGLKDFFDINRFDQYLIRRSLIQHEVIFGGEGLTLLSVDHIYTFKHFVGVLSRINWVPLSRVVCLAACIELLHRINNVYSGQKPLKGYFLRVYTDIDINEETLNEICAEYESKYGKSDTPEAPIEPVEKDDDVVSDKLLPRAKSPTTAIPEFPHPPKTVKLPLPLELPKFISDIESPISEPSDSSILEDRFPIVTYPHIKCVSGVPDSPLYPTPLMTYYLRRPNALCYRCRRNLVPSADVSAKDTTTILGSEWESFRTIGLGLHT